MKIPFGLIALFSLFLMSACSSLTIEPTPTPSATASLTSTWTPPPTNTATFTPTVTFTHTATPTETPTPTMTLTPTKVFIGMNTPFPAEPLELTVIKAWLVDDELSVSVPNTWLRFVKPEFSFMLVRVNISKLGVEPIGMDFIRRDIFVQFDDKDKVICNGIITGGINSPKSITSGLAPGTLPRTFPATFSGLYNVDIADYLFVLTYEPDLNDDLYLFWGEYPPVRLILTNEE